MAISEQRQCQATGPRPAPCILRKLRLALLAPALVAAIVALSGCAAPPEATATPTRTPRPTAQPTALATMVLNLGSATPAPVLVAVAAAPTAVPIQPATVRATAVSATAGPTPDAPTPDAPTPAAPTPDAPTPDAELSSLGGRVNARQGPGTGFDIVGTLQQGQNYQVVGKTVAGDWWEVCCVSEQNAWVWASLSQVTNAQAVAVAADIPVTPTAEAVQPGPTALPLANGGGCPVSSSARFSSIPFDGPSTDIPAEQSGDFNLALRGYAPVDAPLQLVGYNGPTDHDAPQMPGLFTDHRTPVFTAAYQVHDWDRDCGQYGCPGPLLDCPACNPARHGDGARRADQLPVPDAGDLWWRLHRHGAVRRCGADHAEVYA